VQNLNAEVITIGTEILLGRSRIQTRSHRANAARSGNQSLFMTSVGDNEERIANAIRYPVTGGNCDYLRRSRPTMTT
jgi:molybdopterin-biosynthesis enzyme MoeA-like protein